MKWISFMWWHRNWHFTKVRGQVIHPVSFIVFISFIIFYFVQFISGKWIPEFIKSPLLQEFSTSGYAKMLHKTLPTLWGGGTWWQLVISSNFKWYILNSAIRHPHFNQQNFPILFNIFRACVLWHQLWSNLHCSLSRIKLLFIYFEEILLRPTFMLSLFTWFW